MGTTEIQNWGRLPFHDALERQLTLHSQRLQSVAHDTIAVVEHPPTVSLGRRAGEEELRWSRRDFETEGVEVLRSDRGGRATFHGPGQAVVYPIVNITEHGLGVRSWVSLLEESLLSVLGEWGIEGSVRDGTAGIWTAGGKIASIGLRVSAGVSYHGLALNVCLDPSAFDCILPCGVAGEKITTVALERSGSGPGWPGRGQPRISPDSDAATERTLAAGLAVAGAITRRLDETRNRRDQLP